MKLVFKTFVMSLVIAFIIWAFMQPLYADKTIGSDGAGIEKFYGVKND